MTMQNRRTFLGIAAASLLPIGIDAQTGAPAARTQRGGWKHPGHGPPPNWRDTR